MPMSRSIPIAAPRNSARSVAIAIASACTQRPTRRLGAVPLAADLGQVPARRDAELRRERLDQHREQVREHDHPDQRVAELRAGGDVRREVPRVDVRDARDERGAEEGQDAEARPVEGLVDGAEPFGERRAREEITLRMLAMPKTSRERTCSGGAADEMQVGQVAPALVQVEAVADEELVRDREADIADGQIVDEAAVGPVEERRHVERGGVAQRRSRPR